MRRFYLSCKIRNICPVVLALLSLGAYSKIWVWDFPVKTSLLINKSVLFLAVYFEQGKYDECIEECKKAVDVGREHMAGFKIIAK